MRQEKAIRHLILRHLWRFQRHCDSKLYFETANSLSIDRDSEQWIVRWRRSDQDFQEAIPKSDLTLYHRGDLKNSKGVSPDTANDAVAERIARIALSIPDDLLLGNEAVLFPDRTRVLFGTALLGVSFAVAGGRFGVLAGAAVFTAFALEYAGVRGKLLAPLAWASIGLLGSPAAGFFAAASFGAAQILDPNPALRRARTGISLAAAAACVHLLSSTALDWTWAPFTLFCSGLVVFRWLRGTHFRAAPLILPILSAGLYADGHRILAVIGAVAAILSCVSASRNSNPFPRRPAMFINHAP